MSLFTSFNAGVSGLFNSQSGLNTTAHNLANTKTDGYTRQQNINTDTYYQTLKVTSDNILKVGYGTTVAAVRQIRDTFLDDQYRKEVGCQAFYDVHVTTSQEIQDVLGEMDGVEFQDALHDFWNTVQSLSTNPESITNRELFLTQAESFLEKAENVYQSLKDYQINLNSQIEDQVNTINTIADKIAKLNEQIATAEASNLENANDYRDARNLLMDDLAKYTAYESYEDYTGQVVIRINNAPLVDQTTVNHMACEKLAIKEYDKDTDTYVQKQSSQMYNVVWASGGFGNVYDIDQAFDKTDVSDKGSLLGILTARGKRFGFYTDILQEVTDTPAGQKELNQYNNTVGNCLLERVEAQFDLLIHKIVTAVNDAFNPNVDLSKVTDITGATEVSKTDAAGNVTKDLQLTLADATTVSIKGAKVLDANRCPVGTDDAQTIGTEVFGRRATERYTVYKLDHEVTVKDENGDTVALTKDNGDGTYSLYVYNEEDTNDRNTLYTLQNLEMNANLKANYSLLQVHGNPAQGKQDEYDWSAFTTMFASWKKADTILDPNALTKYGVDNYYDSMVGLLATQGSVWESQLTNQEKLVADIESKRQQISGVSTEEEMVSLLMYQHAYNASSRYITTIDDMLDHLINRLG